MATSYTSEVEYLPSKMYTGGCDPAYVAYSSYLNRTMSSVSKAYNLPQSRPKPTDLIKNMTPLTVQYEHKTVTGESGWIRTGVQTDYGCGTPYPKRKAYQKDYLTPTAWAHPVPDPDWPDWSLPLRLAVKDQVINLGATVAEYRESVRMFGSAVQGLRDAVRSIRKLKFMKRRSLCSVTNAHLIHDYGVAPLMSDMFDSWEALRLRLEQPIYHRITLRRRLEQLHTERTDKVGTYSWMDTNIYTNGKQRVRAYVELDRSKASMFTLGNPLEIAWELVPFSFAIDWFIPIGDTLISLDALKAVEDVRVSVSRKKEQRWNYVIRSYDNATYGGGFVPMDKAPSRVHVTHERLVYDSIPLPPLPRPALSGSVNRLLNALSLLVSVRGCKGRMPRFSRKDFTTLPTFR